MTDMDFIVVVHDNTIPVRYSTNELSGCATNMSWQRLTDIMRTTGELRQNESIQGVVCGEDGVQLFLKSS